MASDKQKKQSKQLNKSEEAQSSLTRLSKIPAVAFSLYLTLSAYSKVKASSELLNNVLNRVEKLGLFTIDSLRPLASKFEKQIGYADSLGNSMLDKIETTVPSVTTFQPRTAYANAANRVLSLRAGFQKHIVDNVNSQINLVRSFNLNKIVSGGLKSVDNLVDDYLPASSDDDSAEDQNNEIQNGLISQVSGIVGKLRKRSIKRVQNIQRLVF